MNEIEKHMQHEMIKDMMKQAIDNNPLLNPIQKEQQKARVDACPLRLTELRICYL